MIGVEVVGLSLVTLGFTALQFAWLVMSPHINDAPL